MMLAAIVLSQQDAMPTAASVISKMLARYHDAKTIKGECTTTATIGKLNIVVRSTLQLERPGKLYLRQDVDGKNLSYFLTSDGAHFSYQKPRVVDAYYNPTGRLIEDVTPGTILGDIYRAAAESI